MTGKSSLTERQADRFKQKMIDLPPRPAVESACHFPGNSGVSAIPRVGAVRALEISNAPGLKEAPNVHQVVRR